MHLRKFLCSFYAAVLLGTLSAAPALSEERSDFDSGGIDIRAALKQSREQASLTAAPQGQALASSSETAPLEDDIERSIVLFKAGTPKERRHQIVASAGGVVTHDLWIINAAAVFVPKTKSDLFARTLKSSAVVRRVDRDYMQDWLSLDKTPAPASPEASGWPFPGGSQKTPWGVQRVQAQKAWSVTRGAGVKLAVIDTGVDFDHPELKVAGGFNAIDNAVSFKDDHGHGTHVSGTIAALDNAKGVVGVAPDVTLYGVKVLSASGRGTFAQVIAGMQWCVENGIDVANMSLGGSAGEPALAEAVTAVTAAGVTIVAAAGNSGGSVGYPAAYPEVIAISASTSGDGLANFSSRGPQVDFIAPGLNIPSLFKGGGYKTLSGTSMACPHMAGLAALAVAAKGVRGQEAIRAALTGAATMLPKLSPAAQGAGMIDAGKLVQ
jgi:subtilisin family serine protease